MLWNKLHFSHKVMLLKSIVTTNAMKRVTHIYNYVIHLFKFTFTAYPHADMFV